MDIPEHHLYINTFFCIHITYTKKLASYIVGSHAPLIHLHDLYLTFMAI